MKFKSCCVLSVLCSCMSVWASDFSVGVVDTKSILKQSSRLKEASSQLKSQFSARNEALLAERKTLMNDVKRSHQEAPVLSAQKKAALESSLLKREQTLRQKQLAFSQQVMKAQQAVMGSVYSDLKGIAAKLAKAKHLSLVLDQNGEVLYVNPTYNLTQSVQQQFK